MQENIIAKGNIFELVQTIQPDGKVFEVARRAPGVRIIIADKANKKLLLTKEYRHELKTWDYRLPGGKVFDTLDEFESFRASTSDMIQAAKAKAKQEAKEEAGIDIIELELCKKSTLGATVEWDLYIFVALRWQKSVQGQALESGEKIEADNWFDFEVVKKMILQGSVQEERIALILLQWLETV